MADLYKAFEPTDPASVEAKRKAAAQNPYVAGPVTNTLAGPTPTPAAPGPQPNGQLQPSPVPARVTAPPLTAAPTTTTQQTIRVSHTDPAYPPGFFDRLNPGTPVAGKPGMVWQHDGQGWIQTGSGTSAAPAPDAPAAPPAAAAGAMTPAQASAAGLGWVPPNHPLYGTPGYVGSTPAAAAPPTTGTTPAAGATPGAAAPPVEGVGVAPIPLGPAKATAPPGTPAAAPDPVQEMFRKSLIEQLGTNTNSASITDADLAPQATAFESAVQRQLGARRGELAQQASREGGGGWVEGRLDKNAQEGAQAVGSFNADLVGKKLDARRQQLTTALETAKSLGLASEANDLQRQIANLGAGVSTRGQDVQMSIAKLDASTRTQLANLDAELQRQGYSTQERIARMDTEMKKYGIDTQGQLGKGQLSLDLLRTQLQNQQFNDQLGFQIGTTQAGLNRDALIAGLGGG